MSQEVTTAEEIEVEIIAPVSAELDSIDFRVGTSSKRTQRRTVRKSKSASRKRADDGAKVRLEQTEEVPENGTDFEHAKKKAQDEEDDKRYCEFCGAPLEEQFGAIAAQRRKYCSAKCRSIATGRRTRARLGVRPTRHEISKLNPLYFN